MLIKVTSRSEAVAALLRGETLWSMTTGEGWELDLSCPTWQSKRAVRRFLAKEQKLCYAYDYPAHQWAVKR